MFHIEGFKLIDRDAKFCKETITTNRLYLFAACGNYFFVLCLNNTLGKTGNMLQRMLCFLLLSGIAGANAQFKNDNVLYQTVDPADICSVMKKNPGYLLLDVRTPGEFADTSSFSVYNLGHLKGAINIPVNELGERLGEISDYKNKPVFIYCSHSQRSRRAGKLLADSGFTKVFNVNGGITAFHYNDVLDNNCVADLFTTSNNYKLISAKDLCSKVNSGSAIIIDVRSDSAFRHISRDAKENAIGTIRWSVNVPLSKLQSEEQAIPWNKEIVLTDLYGDQAAEAAQILDSIGYKKVSVLVEGMDRLLSSTVNYSGCPGNLYVSPVRYSIIPAAAFNAFAKRKIAYTILDIRSAEEFTNTHKDYWRNIGHIRGAKNIPFAELENRLPDLNKSQEILIYAFGSSKEVFETAALLVKNGFTKVKVLYGGIFNLRWTAGNVKGMSSLKNWVVDIPEINQ